MSVNSKARRRAKRLRNQPQTVETSGDIEAAAPRSISVIEFVSARAAELNAMRQAVHSSASNKQLFQTLPRHMRRRAASHNPKRLPKRLRVIDMSEKEGTPEVGEGGDGVKKKSRKFRRKVKNLRKEYETRQDGKRWLETHLWHAKRMKMVNKFGFRLAEENCGKGVRATYRALRHGCLLHDMSYYRCIQLTGSQLTIMKALETVTSPDSVKSLYQAHILDGSHELTTLFHRRHSHPHDVIGPAKLLWQQQVLKPAGSDCRLWIWMHPACADEAFTEFKFEFDEQQQSEATVELLDDLVRFRLMGPRSHVILCNTIHSVVSDVDRLSANGEGDVVGCGGGGGEFWCELAGCALPSCVSPCVVVGLDVVDPRYLLPPKKVDLVSECYPKKKVDMPLQKQLDISDDSKSIIPPITPLSVPTACLTQTTSVRKVAVSSLWSPVIRKQAKDNKSADHEINQRRSKLSVPGMELPITEETSRVPLLLVHQEGSRDVSRLGCGWDIILPAGWSMAFWIAFVYRGARAAAIADMMRVDVEMGKLSFPLHFPDSLAGQQEAAANRQSAKEKYLRYPPDKRPSFAKLGTATPFYANWDGLVELWTRQTETDEKPEAKRVKTSERSWYVLRSKDTLNKIQNFISSHHSTRQKKLPPEVSTLLAKQLKDKGLTQHSTLPPDSSLFVPPILYNPSVLMYVSFTMVHRGSPSSMSMVCLPSSEDIASLQQDKTFASPVEPIHKSEKESTSISCRDTKSMQVFSGATTRVQIGYVISGDFCFTRGCGTGIALCVASGLLQSIMKTVGRKPLILIRECNSFCYRFAEFVLTEIVG